MPSGDTSEHFATRVAAALDQWGARDKKVRFWWRDDDAVRAGPSLQRLFDVVEGGPLALAVIPESAQADLAEVVAEQSGVSVFQHGWAHVNHAPRGQGLGAWELDRWRPAERVLADVQAGKNRLDQLFGDRFVPVMVPPWNNIHAALLPGLAALGFVGVSTMGATPGCEPVAGLRRIDCRFDVLRWKTGARFAGWARAADALTRLLRDPTADGIVGINTHHKVTDPDGWTFIERLRRLVAEHPAADWVRPEQLFTQR